MRVLIDTNILLGFYDLSGADLDELKNLVELVKDGQITLLLPQQVVDEYWRNRESVIVDALKRFQQTNAQATVPNVIRVYPDAKVLRQAVNKVNQLVKDLTKQARADIEASALGADLLIEELFATAGVSPVAAEVIARAEQRCVVGNPPGKKGSHGDAINWEWLLSLDVAAAGEETIIVSGDGDYESELVEGELKEFLAREWKAVRADESLYLDTSVTDFLKREFPQIQLVDEADKLEAIKQLEDSWSFAATHAAVAKLANYDDFSDDQVKRILGAIILNEQVGWILGDDDVSSLAKKVFALVNSEEAAVLSGKVSDMMAQYE